ncbi:MAG: AraC family transcriptional regulator [Phycisphaerae bacterium]|nr:AraC family transcriptional regulator [Gemmatimonadaceae bacterium]
MHTSLRLSTMQELAVIVEQFSGGEGLHRTAISGLSLLRATAPFKTPMHSVHEPALCLVVQGAKQVILNGEVYSYDPSRYLIVSMEVPVSGQVTRASADEPYLCVKLDLDAGEIAALILMSGLGATREPTLSRAMALAPTSAPLLDAVLRLTRLLESEEDIEALAPLARREILYRLLKSEQGAQMRQIAATGGPSQRVARAIGWLKKHFAEPLHIEEIARQVHMSPSSLHHHFKAVTAMSPLQYQKQLRLQEARRLMLATDVDAASAAYRVGYESPSQFGREYRRLFGAPPATDVRRLREQIPGVSTRA